MHDQWVDRRLAALDPPKTWQPNATRALTQVRDRQKAYRIRRTRWKWAAVAASVTAVGLFLLAPAPCSGAGCSKAVGTVAPAPAVAPIGAMPMLRPREALAIVQICGAEVRSFCAGVPFGGCRIITCLAANASSLSPGCYSALSAAAVK